MADLGSTRVYGDLTVTRSLTVAGKSLEDSLGERVPLTDDRLTDAREWTASEVPQAEAEGGTAQTPRKWTSLRVRQAIVAWWNSVSSAWGRGFVASADAAAGRTALGLGSAATTPSTAYATAAQGALAASALQPATIGTTVQGYSAALAGTNASFTSTLKGNYDAAYSWGNHASAGYATQSWVTDQLAGLGGGGGGMQSLVSLGTHSANATLDLDLSAGDIFAVYKTGAVSRTFTLTVSNEPTFTAGIQTWHLILQCSAGSAAITWPAGWSAAAGVNPTIPSGAMYHIFLLTRFSHGGVTYRTYQMIGGN